MSIITCKGLSKTYHISLFRKDSRKALENLSLTISEGETLGIVGPNGAGKSTFLKILMGFIRADTGEILIAGQTPSSPESRNQVGYLPENHCLYKQLSISDHLWFAGRANGRTTSWIQHRIETVLSMVELDQNAKTPVHRLSKGMTQRAALAYALFSDPDIIVLDEPMSGLDPLGRKLVIDLLERYSQSGKTILFCSHILADVERICTRIGVMDRGQLIALVTPEDLRTDAQVSSPQKRTPLESFFLDKVRQPSIHE